MKTILKLPVAATIGALMGAAMTYNFATPFMHFVSPEFLGAFLAFNVVIGVILTIAGALLARLILRGKRSGAKQFAAFVLIFALPTIGFYVEDEINFEDDFDVMLVIVDAVRADYLGVYGYNQNTSPRLENFARDAVVFERAISQGAHTIQSTPAILASVYPVMHGLRDYELALNSGFELISEVLLKKNYFTLGIATNPHLSAANGFNQGYSHYAAAPTWAKVAADTVNSNYFSVLRTKKLDMPIQARRNESPLFSFLFYIDPHTPYKPPHDYLRLFFDGDPVEMSSWTQETYEKLDENGREFYKASYLAELRYFDNAFGDLLDGMKKIGTYDNTLIIFTSDHGEGFFDHGLVGHGNSLYNELIHVPLMIKFPDLVKFPRLNPAGGRLEPLVRHIDILPTVCDFLGYTPPALAQGVSLLPIVYNKVADLPELDYVLSENMIAIPMPGREEVYGLRCLTTDQFKLIVNGLTTGTGQRAESYDIPQDPLEQRNLHPALWEVEDSLAKVMLTMLKRLKPLGKTPSKAEVDEQTLNRLKALGYLQ